VPPNASVDICSRVFQKIVTDGAIEADLPLDYLRYLQNIPTYKPPRSKRGRAGAAIFVGFWGPIMGVMEKITHATLGPDGYCPWVVIAMVRITMLLIWITHDVFFVPLCGRGDGRGEDRSQRGRIVDEETPLFEKGPSH
jgi:gliotoxin/aspirochlorine biosynthesis gamma-glutamylcyclotransferase